MYSSIDEGAAEASRKNLRRSKSAVSDSPYKRVNLPRRSSGSMREVNVFGMVLNAAISFSYWLIWYRKTRTNSRAKEVCDISYHFYFSYPLCQNTLLG